MTEQFHPEETRNTPDPRRLKLWQPNEVLGRVVKNCERRTKTGLIIANTQQCQDYPYAMQIIKISPYLHAAGHPEHHPAISDLAQAMDPEHSGKLIENGPYVTFAWNAARRWEFPLGEGGETYALVNARYIYGEYIPVPAGEDNDFEMAKGVEQFRNESLERAASAPSKSVPSMIVIKNSRGEVISRA